MPIYEYVCPECEFKFELLRSLNQSSEAASCPHCRKSAERVLSIFASFSADESGMTVPIGGNACASCSTAGCDTCSV